MWPCRVLIGLNAVDVGHDVLSFGSPGLLPDGSLADINRGIRLLCYYAYLFC